MTTSRIRPFHRSCRLLGACSAGVWALASLAGTAQAQTAHPAVVHAAEAGGTLGAASAQALAEAETRHVIEAGGATADMSDNSPDWRDGYLKGTHHFGEQGVLQWQVDSQKHYGERGTSGAISYTRDINPDWYFSVGASAGSASFMPKARADVGLYYKWLASRQLVTGITGMWSESGDDIHSDRALGLNASYYFSDLPLVLQGGVTFNQSNPGGVNTRRGFAALTYGRDKAYYLTLRHEAGREGYLPAGAQAGTAVDFSSRATSASWRHWISPRFGYVVGGEHYSNPYYKRNAVNAGVFYSF